MAEIQQTYYLTYRFYEYNHEDANGKGRELHTELAKDAIDYTVYPDYKTQYQLKSNDETPLVSCKYFTTNLLDLTQPIKREVAKNDSFSILMCMDGRATLTDNNGYKTEIKQGDTFLIPANTQWVEIVPSDSIKLVESYIG